MHLDYSQKGRDIKVAIYDDMLEITSPGTLLPAIDIGDLAAGQSEIRNHILAPIFKMTNLIEQWGTGFGKVSTEMKAYPELEVKYLEPGLSFQVQFVKKLSVKSSNNTQGSDQYRASTAQVLRK